VKESSSILTFLKNIIRKICSFLKKTLSKEVLTFLIFLLISCFFWVLQSLQEVSEMEMEIPISYSEIPPYISITNKLPEIIKVSLRDKGSNLYYSYRHRKELTVNIDLMKWYHKESVVKIPGSTFDTYLRNRLKPTTQLLRLKPDTIPVYFVEKSSKKVPVHLNSILSLLPQHIFSDLPIINPSVIEVFAPASVLEHLDRVETEMLELKNLDDSIAVILNLKPIEGVRFSTEKVKVRLDIEEFTEKSMMISVTGINFPDGEVLLSFPLSVKVTFFVGISAYSRISPNDFQISVDYTHLMQSDKKAQNVVLVKSPENVRNVRIQPETVDCLIEKN